MSYQPQPSLQARALPCLRGIDVLHVAIAAHSRRDPRHDSHDHWRYSARLMCEDARTRGVRIEELLISLKRTWPTMRGIDRLPRDESARLLSRVVTLCVEEYYSPLD